MQILDGKALAQKIEEKVSLGAKELKTQTGRVPGLAVILVGHDPASQAYVENIIYCFIASPRQSQ